jgi:hypothetical protein
MVLVLFPSQHKGMAWRARRNELFENEKRGLLEALG